jgi:hypothetical protein
MNPGQYQVKKKANDGRIKKIRERLTRFDPEFKEWVEENKNLAREERLLNNSDPRYAALWHLAGLYGGADGARIRDQRICGRRFSQSLIDCQNCWTAA